MALLSCAVNASQECLDFVQGWSAMESLLVQLLPPMLIVIACIKLARFAGEDG